MLQDLKERWEIQKNWQYLFPIVGYALVLLTSYYITNKLVNGLAISDGVLRIMLQMTLTLLGHFFMLRFFLWCFKKLYAKWGVNYKWEMIAIFIAFAITGSASGRLAGPVVHFFGLYQETSSGWVYWPIRILLIFPLYQVLVVLVGWLFGQFEFFWNFEKKMLKRLGLGFLFS